jgi:hypothetical protein
MVKYTCDKCPKDKNVRTVSLTTKNPLDPRSMETKQACKDLCQDCYNYILAWFGEKQV